MTILAAAISYKRIQFFIRMLLFVVLGVLVLVIRARNKKKTRKRMDERTAYMMKHTKRDKNGKYPWEN
ncbi:hypothetical protein [Levilactobacillus acidifarinae]|uniref:Uncharacterized protein n=1 Tax=Levilactobacillus acidifarinae DSM 19394 = JCM 15949 TaxID=1423715 RepID=A0A0R1LH41_9LACO|nr:hypothetical protein [Levilactobacillus acidifarinae]KRK94848.1 hypothetical protein FD25_GL000825 [Levilactobacillus acidifarinae DSM 19394]GEO68607.1 hypothetical protein LAC03_05170 [Levilactobacillus acidifarinae]